MAILMGNATMQNIQRMNGLTRPCFDSTGSQVFMVWHIGRQALTQAQTDGVIEDEDEENEGGVQGNNLFDQTGGIFAQGQQA